MFFFTEDEVLVG